MAIPPNCTKIGAFLGFFISTASFALPEPLLGPDGPLWLGPHHPASALLSPLNHEWITVDPRSGALQVERQDFSRSKGSPVDIVRRFQEGQWSFSFERRLSEQSRTVTVSGEHALLEFVKPGAPGEPVLIGTSLEKSGQQLVRTAEGWTLTEANHTWRFNVLGELLEEEDPQGRRTEYQWLEGRLDAIIGLNTKKIQVRHNANGDISVLESKDGVACYYEHRIRQLIAARCNDGERSRYLYNDNEQLRSILWADSSAVSIQYNSQQQVAAFYGPGLTHQAYQWKDNGVDVVETNGASTQIRWKPEGGYEVIGPTGQRVAVTLTDGQIRSWQDPAGGETRLRYDTQGRLKSLDTAGQGAWNFKWKDTGLSSVENPLGAVWSFKRNQKGRVMVFQEPSGVQTSFRRNTAGLIRSIKTANGSREIRRDSEGRVIGIHSSSGAETRIQRNSLGDITAFIDPAGQTIQLGRGPNGTIRSVTDRTGEQWKIDRDVLGRTRGIHTPTGGRIQWTRNSQGRIQRLQADENRWVEYATTVTGQPSLIRSSSGRERGLFWSLGRLRGIRLEDHTELQLQRDLHGRLLTVVFGENRLEIQRNALGMPEKVGPLQYEWLGSQMWTSVTGPGIQLKLARGFEGSIRNITLGEESLTVSRDASGRLSWVGTGENRITFSRDANGSIVKLVEGDQTTHLTRDVRGLVTDIRSGELHIRQSFDPEGRLLQIQDNQAGALSAQYDAEGRFSFIRFPQGGLLRFGLGPSNRFLLFEGPNGESLLTRHLTYNPHGELAMSQEGERSRMYHRDLRGRLAAVEESPTAWSWIPGAVEGPNEFLLLLDENHRPVRATLPLETQHWGALATEAVYRQNADQITQLSTNSGSMAYTLDGLGRPTSLTREDGSEWTLTWNPLGQLTSFTDPSGEATKLQFGPTGLLGIQEGETLSSLLHIGDWAWIKGGESSTEWMRDESGQNRLQNAQGESTAIEWTPLGMPNQAHGGPRSKGSISIPWAGLVLDSQGAIESLSGQRIQSSWTPPWSTEPTAPSGWPALGESTNAWWAPDRWMSQGQFQSPVSLAIELGILDPKMEDSWTTLQNSSAPLPWLPPSAKTPAPPLGPPRESIPLVLGPLETLCLKAAIGPVFSLDTPAIGKALLAPEFEDLPELQWLSDQGWSWWLMDADQWLGLP